MNLSTRPIHARTAVPVALLRALQWRLLLLWALASLGCALVATLPLWGWLESILDHSLHTTAIAQGKAPMLLADALLSPQAPLSTIGSSFQVAAGLMLLLSPLLVGATLVAARSPVRLGFGDLLRGAIGEFWPLLRLWLWSFLPLGAAALVTAGLFGIGSKVNEHAILATDVSHWTDAATIAGGILLVLAHASVEAGRGWLAADPNLRSAIKAWWRGATLLCKRPIAVLSSYLFPWLLAALVALALFALRQKLDGGLAIGLLLSSLIGAALAWGKVARLFALRTLANDRRQIRH